MNRKADLMNNALETIVAVVGIALLLFGIGYVGYKFLVMNQTQEIKNAKHHIDIIEAKINALENGQKTESILQKIGEGWVLVGWSKTDPPDSKPEKCFLTSCVCICPDSNQLIQSCQEKGLCRTIEHPQLKVKTAYREDFCNGEIVNIEGEILMCKGKVEVKTSFEDKIELNKNLMQLEISKTDDLIEIIYNSDIYVKTIFPTT